METESEKRTQDDSREVGTEKDREAAREAEEERVKAGRVDTSVAQR